MHWIPHVNCVSIFHSIFSLAPWRGHFREPISEGPSIFWRDLGVIEKNLKHGANEPIFDVRYELKSPIACDQGGSGPNSRRRCLHNFFAWSIPYAPCGHRGHTLGSKFNRVAGRVIKNPLESVTIDLLMKCSQSFSANGVDWKFRFRDPTVLTHWEGFCRVFTTRKS